MFCARRTSAGWKRFHVVGFSGGGAAALACAATHPDRLASLALIEPAWAGDWDLSPAEKAARLDLERLRDVPGEDFMTEPSCASLSSRVSCPRPHLTATRRPGWRNGRQGSAR